MKLPQCIAVGLLFAAIGWCADTSPADRILGTWIASEAGAKVEIVHCGPAYCGSIKSLAKPASDIHNPDPALQSRPLLGLQILTDLKYDGADVWKGGRMYGPERGREGTPRAVLTSPDVLEIKVTIGILSRTVTWTRDK